MNQSPNRQNESLPVDGRPHQRPGHRPARSLAVAASVVIVGLLGACGLRAADNTSSGKASPTPDPTMQSPSGPGLDASSLAISPAGTLLISRFSNDIVSQASGGALDPVAGTGAAGFAGDGGPAPRAELNQPQGLAVSADGTIYFADTQNNRVRAISPNGIITTVAGTGTHGSSGPGGPAPAAQLNGPQDVALAPNGVIYISVDGAIDEVSHGQLSLAIRGGPGSLGVTGTSAAKDTGNCGPTCSLFPGAIAVDPAGNLYVADSSPKVLAEFSPKGQIINAWSNYSVALATAPDGSIVAADYGNYSIDRIAGGTITSIETFKIGTPFKGMIFRPNAVAVAANGDIYVSDGVHLVSLDPAGKLEVFR
jgi:sugar lactone lactonase YvrE